MCYIRINRRRKSRDTCVLVEKSREIPTADVWPRFAVFLCLHSSFTELQTDSGPAFTDPFTTAVGICTRSPTCTECAQHPPRNFGDFFSQGLLLCGETSSRWRQCGAEVCICGNWALRVHA